VKVLRRELVHGDARERFIREARTAARLTHPHIVPLYSFGQAADTLYYIMGFVEGESLESRLLRGPRPSIAEVRRILAELADALEYAHAQGVVHRDIKPDNVMLDGAAGRAILTDFGIAKTSTGGDATITRTGMIVGTPLYMSPEQAAGDRVVDGRSDLYALGVIGYRMLTGRLPFEGTSIQDLFIRQATENPTPVGTLANGIPPELASAVMRCLEKDPMHRWPAAAVFQRALIAQDPRGGETGATAGAWTRLLRRMLGAKPVHSNELGEEPSGGTATDEKILDNGDGLSYSITTPVHSGMFDHIDPRSPTPLYAQIATRIKVAIAAGELVPGEALPSVRTLATRLRINPATVVQAYRDLELEGLVSTRQGAGTFVQDIAPDRKHKDRAAEALRLVRGLVAQAGSLGITTAELRSAIDQELTAGTAGTPGTPGAD
jgi:serine/threonine protein kinase/DNA-binding transcriptional regulator YhcF (GntR family)